MATATEVKRPKLDDGSSPSSSSGGIVTHSGTHHADEALAVFLLRKLPEFQSLPLTRTRDPEQINAGKIVVDVGAEYDYDRLRFDHHQRGFTETFDSKHKTKLSSAGLVWKHFGPQILSAHLSIPVEDAKIQLLWQKMYDDFVEAIDGIDNGITQHPNSTQLYKSSTDLSSRVGYLNPRWNQTSSPEDSDRRFEKASKLAGEEFFDRVDYAFEAWLPARDIVDSALAVRVEKSGDDSGRILVFDEYASWKSHLYDLEAEPSPSFTKGGSQPILYVIYPDESGKWRIQAVSETAESFVSRKALPEQWRGVRDEELSKVSGVPGGVFVHASGFIGGNQTRDGALEMARRALAA